MKAYAGVDLHSSNNFTAIIDEQDRRLYARKLPNKLNAILLALDPFKESIRGVVVESHIQLVLVGGWVAGAWIPGASC